MEKNRLKSGSHSNLGLRVFGAMKNDWLRWNYFIKNQMRVLTQHLRHIVATALWSALIYKIYDSVLTVQAKRVAVEEDNVDADRLALPSITLCPRQLTLSRVTILVHINILF